MADIHANREAFSACLAHAEALGVSDFVFLGDYVGYGADPAWTVDTIQARMARGAIAIRGNHEAALGRDDPHLNDVARASIIWTRAQLTAGQRHFLEDLPLCATRGDNLFVHASASHPDDFGYVTGAETALQSLLATAQRVVFCGHVHVPQLYFMSAAAKVASFEPVPSVAIPLTRPRRWLAVMGAVGQPRDGMPAACYAVFDDSQNSLTYFRIPYDTRTAAAKVREAGLPGVLAERLLRGR